METLSVRDYRNNLSASFDRADNGEQVFIRRRNQIYALVNVGHEDLVVTPELRKRIDKVNKAVKDGRCVTFNNREELNAFFDSL